MNAEWTSKGSDSSAGVYQESAIAVVGRIVICTE